MHLYIHFDPITIRHTVSADDALTALIQSIKEDIATMSTTLDQAIADLQADVTQETSVTQSAVTLILRRNPRMDMQPMGGNR